ncbi:Gfo/Idh/MocA family protein [Herbiconiux sp. VKM Ac-2851]|uniref:Gfo/Idh/MocA family protein n=1 Tax=Herbiconiux sp. VKM Ac-2851 TaxID=2739025 RepID=UPI00352EE37B
MGLENSCIVTVDQSPLRIGVLGAARIVRDAIIRPSHRVSGVVAHAVAARDQSRAKTFASDHGIQVAHESYESLLRDPTVDAVYVPLPASLHAEWVVAAVEAGKDVICEKPFAGNAASASRVEGVAAQSDRVVMEAYHSHYHPLYGRLRDIIHDGEIGCVHSARSTFFVPIPPGKDIRWSFPLGGGSLLDIGYYPVRAPTELFGSDAAVSRAQARTRGPIDRRMDATLTFPAGITATVSSAMWSFPLFEMSLTIEGSDGSLRVTFPFHPQMGSRIRIRRRGRSRTEMPTRKSTYDFQLEAFRDAVKLRSPVETNASAATAHLELLDAIYQEAGLPLRP